MAALTLSACLAEIKARPGKFYVYVLSDPDGLPFYVGCGRGGRITRHLKEAKSKAKSVKVSVIRAALNAGVEISYTIDSWHSDWPAALGREVDLIALLGRHDLGTGPLTNLTEGGEGVVSSPTSREKQRASMRRRWADPSESARLCAAMRAGCSDEKRERMRVLGKVGGIKKWADPAWREKEMNRRRAEPMSVETRRKIGDATKRANTNPEVIARRKAGRQFTQTDEFKKARSAISKRYWSDPTVRASMVQKRKDAGDRRRELWGRCQFLVNEIVGETPDGHSSFEDLAALAARLERRLAAIRRALAEP